MCIPNNSQDMTSPNELSETPGMKSSFKEKSRFEFILMDCCSFVGVALGVYDDIPPCATVALIDSDYSDGSISDDSELVAGASVFSRDVVQNETSKNANDTTTAITLNTISTLTMEKIPLSKRISPSKANDYGLPSNFSGENVFEDSESLSTLNIPPSLDTKTVEMPSSSETKTLSKALLGLKLVESKVKDTKQNDTEREIPNRSNPLRQRNPYDIERVPSLVDTSTKDDESVVSAISVVDAKAKEATKKRLFKGKGKMLRPWSWKNNSNKKEGKETAGAKSPSIWRASFDPTPTTDTKSSKTPTKSAFPSITIMKPTEIAISKSVSPVSGSIPSPIRRHDPRASPANSPKTFRSMVPAITITKSNDITASTVGTEDEERTDNIPFDEEPSCKTNSPSRHQTKNEMMVPVRRYVRPSSKLDF